MEGAGEDASSMLGGRQGAVHKGGPPLSLKAEIGLTDVVHQSKAPMGLRISGPTSLLEPGDQATPPPAHRD
eukprot:12005014-Alexandrium_andersonii.AAC.1